LSVGGLEPIAEQLSGGQLLPPVQTLVATFIFSPREKMHIESNKGSQSDAPLPVADAGRGASGSGRCAT